MKAKLLSVAVALVALAAAPPALADGGPGGFQAGLQGASTGQAAVGVAKSDQNAVNANVPVSIAGGNVTAGPSNATQNASSASTANVSNESATDQHQNLDQNLGSSSCVAGCGGSGGLQAGVQKADTQQLGVGVAKSDQNAVNANVPVSIAGGDVTSGSSNATQNASSTATTDVSNGSDTGQSQKLDQDLGGSSCHAGCGGAGGFQAGIQKADTNQAAVGVSKSKQNAVNANVPVSIAGGNIDSGSSNATQNASSNATTDVSNDSGTEQHQKLNQDFGCGCDSKDGKVIRDGKDGSNGCYAGCGGPGGFQLGIQKAETNQGALGIAKSDQNAVNANTPVSIAGHDISSGDSNATQNASSDATANVSNESGTEQHQKLNQDFGSSSCLAGCGGAGGFQVGVQKADTNQWALGYSKSKQNAVNANTPVSTAGGDIYAGDSNATQNASSTATTDVSNLSATEQHQKLNQDFGCGCDGKDGKGGCLAGCGGPGGFQLGIQKADTNQWALGVAKSDQNAVNSNAPVSTAGGDIYSGDSNATQNAASTATTDVSNSSETGQHQKLDQSFGCGCDGKDGRDGKDGLGGGSLGSGGAGGFQLGIQKAETNQWALGIAKSDQNAVNSNTPVSTAGGDIYAGDSNATQNAASTATTDVSNDSGTWQHQRLVQDFGCGCEHPTDKGGNGSPWGGGTLADDSSEAPTSKGDSSEWQQQLLH